jgi:small-conductance mechanosensitive channel
MEESTQIVEFLRVGGLITSMFLLAGIWLVNQILLRTFDRIGSRFTEQRMRIHQVGTFIRFFLYFAGFFVTIFLSFRLSSELLLAVGGTLAVTLGFALKDLAASLIASLTILLDKPFQVGDRISFGGFYGEVTAIGLRSVRLLTLDDNLVTIPNNKFLTDLTSTGNAGELDMLIQMDFFVGIDQDISRAKEIVSDALTSTRYAYLKKPWSVLVNQVIHENYFALRLRSKVYVLDVRYEKALESDVTERTLAGFRAAGIQPPAILHRSLGSTDEALAGPASQE